MHNNLNSYLLNYETIAKTEKVAILKYQKMLMRKQS